MHTRTRVRLALVVGATVAVAALDMLHPLAAQAAPTPAQRCAAAKLTLSGKALTASARCSQRAAAAGTGTPDMSCTTKVYQALNEKWATIEAKGGCDPTSDPGGVTFEVSGLEGGLYQSLGLTPASECTAGKIRAAGKKGACLLRGYARQTRRGEPFSSDPACTAKFSTAFAALEARGGCSTTGDVAAVEGALDQATTIIHSAATGVPMCCTLGTTCLPFDVSTLPTCLELGAATVGSVGTVCDGLTGGCVSPPANPGACCDLDIGGCVGGPFVFNAIVCSFMGGTFSVGTCTLESGCVP